MSKSWQEQLQVEDRKADFEKAIEAWRKEESEIYPQLPVNVY